MKLHYYADTDSLYIELSAAESVETRPITSAVNIDFGGDGAVVGIDIDHASRQLDLATLETSALPLQSLHAA